MVWLVHPTLPTWRFGFKLIWSMEDMIHIQVKDELFGEDWLKSFATEILDAKYEKTDVAEVKKGLTHLNTHQKADLLWVLQENKEMLDETLNVYPHKTVHFDIDQKCQVCAFYALPSTLNPCEDFQKGVWPSCWTWCISTTTREKMGVPLIVWFPTVRDTSEMRTHMHLQYTSEMRTHTHPQYTSNMRTHTHPQYTSKMHTHTHPQYTSEMRTHTHPQDSNDDSHKFQQNQSGPP